MELEIKKLDEVWTADSQKLGLAQYLFHRTKEIDPDLQYYASYLEVEDYQFGSTYYVPTDYITGKDPETGRVLLAVTSKQVMERTWFRMPDFIAHGQERREKLPE